MPTVIHCELLQSRCSRGSQRAQYKCNSDQSVSTVWHTYSWHRLLAQANNSVVTAALHCSYRPCMLTVSANVCVCLIRSAQCQRCAATK
eukprot:776-Heterococcus_DN1.PRE.2